MKFAALFLAFAIFSACSEEAAVKPPAPPEVVEAPKPVKQPVQKKVVEKKKSKKEIQAEVDHEIAVKADAILEAMKLDPTWDFLTQFEVIQMRIMVPSLVRENKRIMDETWSQLSVAQKILIRNNAPAYIP